MTLAAGILTSGKTGALATKSLAASGVQRNISISRINPIITRGDSLVPLINNVGYATNKVVGLTTCRLDVAMPLNPLVTPADFFTRAFLSVQLDTSAINYHTWTHFPDLQGNAPLVYALCKYYGFTLSVSFSPNGAAQSAVIGMSASSADPESGSVAALTTPSAGALSTGGIVGFAQSGASTGASNVVQFDCSVDTDLQMVPGVVAGTNAKYPYLIPGTFQNDLTGQVNITQFRNSTTVLGADGSDGTYVLSLGTAGAGLSFTFKLMPLAIGKPSNLGGLYMRSTYALKSIDGTTPPLVVADL